MRHCSRLRPECNPLPYLLDRRPRYSAARFRACSGCSISIPTSLDCRHCRTGCSVERTTHRSCRKSTDTRRHCSRSCVSLGRSYGIHTFADTSLGSDARHSGGWFPHRPLSCRTGACWLPAEACILCRPRGLEPSGTCSAFRSRLCRLVRSMALPCRASLRALRSLSSVSRFPTSSHGITA